MEWLGRLSELKSLAALDKAITQCSMCERLVSWRQEIATTKRKSYADETYWGKPVPGFGPSDASIVVVGLAPGAHGANRTGRIFTGDKSGEWLYGSLFRNGLAKIPSSESHDDGQELFGVRITCAVHCVPPDNKPSTAEKAMCSHWFVQEISLILPTAKTFVVLGNFAWNALLHTFKYLKYELPKPQPKFGHGAHFEVVGLDGRKRLILGSYHPSQQNTFTGKLTQEQLDQIFAQAKGY